MTPETRVLHEIKVMLKALYSWEILFIINIYITTHLLAKHMFTFFHSVSLRDSAGQRFFRALDALTSICVFSYSPSMHQMFTKSLRGQMLLHILLSAKEPECILLVLSVCIREK